LALANHPHGRLELLTMFQEGGIQTMPRFANSDPPQTCGNIYTGPKHSTQQ